MWISIWTGDITCAYLWTNPLSEIYVWATKVRPTITEALIDFLLVWGWGAGWQSWGLWWWGGWAGWVVYCEWELLQTWTYSVCIWKWGCGYIAYWCCPQRSGEDSCFISYVACGGGWGWYWCATGTWYLSPNWYDWASWWWGARCGSWGTGTQWCNWWAWVTWNAKYGGSWGGGYTSEWCIATTTWSGLMLCHNWGDGWLWYNSDITWQTEYYAYWGWGGASTRWTPWDWHCWWGDWGTKCNCPCYANWCPATTYGSWWGWAWDRCTCCSGRTYGGDGCQWIFIARYPSSCWYNISWGCKYECNWYCIHCFTSDGTLTVN